MYHEFTRPRASPMTNRRRLIWIAAMAIFCAYGQLGCRVQECRGIADGRPGSSGGFATLPILVPRNVLSGERWDFRLASQSELQRILDLPMPKPSEVDAEATIADVISKRVQKRLLWVPELSASDAELLHQLKFSSGYRDVQLDVASWTVGKHLDAFLSMTTELGIHARLDLTEGNPNLVNVALITERFIVIICIPDE